MELQTIIVGLIILAALGYAGRNFFSKLKSFTADNSCGGDCGCGTTSKSKNLFMQIKRGKYNRAPR